MTTVTCSDCKALFEVDFAPGTEFACGDCGATVTVPVLPVVMPGRRPGAARPPGPAAPAPRGAAPAAKRPAVAAARAGGARPGASRPAPPAKKKPPVGVYAAVGAVVLGIGIGAIVFLSGDKKPGGSDGSEAARTAPARPDGAPVAPPPPPDPYVQARQNAEKAGTPEALLAFADLAWTRSEEAVQKGDEAALKAAKDDWRWAYEKLLEKDPEHALARERLGHVLFDPEKFEGFAEASWLPEDVKTDLGLASDDIVTNLLQGKPRRLWLTRQQKLGREWAAMSARIEKFRKGEAARKTDPFYPDAERKGRDLVAELSNESLNVNFRRKGVTGDAFLYFVQKPYIMVVQREASGGEKKIADEWLQVLEDLHTTFYAKFGARTGLSAMEIPTPVIILRDGGEYAKYLRIGVDVSLAPPAGVSSGAHYEPWSNRLVVYLQSGGEEELRGTVFHEGTHQIIEFAINTAGSRRGLTQSFWFSEGIADYFGGHAKDWDEDMQRFRYLPGRINKGRIKTLVDSISAGSLFPIEELLDYKRSDYQREKEDPHKQVRIHNAYAQGWGLVYLLNEGKDGKYREDFVAYLKEEFAGRSGKAAFEKVFGKYGLEVIEEDLLELIEDLRVALRENRIVGGRLLPKR